ncbi:ABC transporter permease [Bacillus timonensis]|nr:ABC transporter permease [Bacillus timonensis]
MNMYLHELKSYRQSTMIWTMSLIGLVAIFFSMYPSISNDAANFKQFLQGIPEELRKAIGLSIDSFTSILGFFSYGFVYIKLCGSIQAMNLGTSIVSKETRDKTADFLLTKPISRHQIITSKLLASLTSLIITNILFVSATVLLSQIIMTSEFEIKTLTLLALSLFFLQLIFLGIGILAGVIFPKIKSVISVSLGTVFTFFILSMISSTFEDALLRYLTPFNYFEPTFIIKNNQYELPFLIVSICILIISISASYSIYRKKDVHTI